MLPVRCELVFSSKWYEIPPLPVPLEPIVITIQFTSVEALQLHTSPVVTVMRPLLAAAPPSRCRRTAQCCWASRPA